MPVPRQLPGASGNRRGFLQPVRSHWLKWRVEHSEVLEGKSITADGSVRFKLADRLRFTEDVAD
jgi:hypothetical protein